MVSFLISIAALVLGYLFYGKFVESHFQPDPSLQTPAVRINDGVDYVPMKGWKIYMIQFLNIAGTGPIFGAIMGAKFGPSCYLWIVFGSIFAGAVHDYISGMISLRRGGCSVPEIAGHYMGRRAGIIMSVIILALLLLVGAVFIYSPALILGGITDKFTGHSTSPMIWVIVIVVYYIIATFLSIDKIIGKIYPIFAFSIIFMALALFICLLIKWPSIPEFWNGLQNRGPEVGMTGQSIFPCLFITVACGAISGFHATQSPLMARCMTNEKQGRPIFYGSMITEGVIALIWAAIGSYFFFDGGMAEVGATGSQAPEVVTSVANSWLGIFGGLLAIIGVVAAPISTGDTAFRSARLILSELFHIDQKPFLKRLLTALPMFAIAGVVLWYNISDPDGFNKIWRYFGWTNQTLACFTLWLITKYLSRNAKKKYSHLITSIPAYFMTAVCITFICVDSSGFGLPQKYIPYIVAGSVVISTVLYTLILRTRKGSELIR
jgi:Carbon starvation protein, predicted membrane protein